MTKEQQDKYLSPLWQRKRLEILSESSFKCTKCGDKQNTLHVHHWSYKKRNEPWEYENSNFLCVCLHCHAEIEAIKKEKPKYNCNAPNRIRRLCLGNGVSFSKKIMTLKQLGDSFTVKTEVERQAVCRMAKALRDIEAISFNITTRACDAGFNVIAIP